MLPDPPLPIRPGTGFDTTLLSDTRDPSTVSTLHTSLFLSTRKIRSLGVSMGGQGLVVSHPSSPTTQAQQPRHLQPCRTRS